MSCCCQPTALDSISLDYYPGDTVGILAVATLDGAAYDLAGCALRFTVADPSQTPPATLWDRQIGQGIAILEAAAGRALITPTLAESQALVAGRTYAARAVLTDAAGAIITTATGYLHARS